VIGIGHNNPPISPIEAAEAKADALCASARNMLYSTLYSVEIVTQAEADAVADLLVRVKHAWFDADKARKAERAPHDAAAREVQGLWKPLLNRLEQADAELSRPLGEWLGRQQAALALAQQKARDEAEAARLTASLELQAADRSNPVEREAAERLLREAKDMEADARQLGRAKASAGGAEGRAAHLRTAWEVMIHDPQAAVMHYWNTRPGDILELVTKLANEDVRRHGIRRIPGCTITQVQRVV
jgi:hypothetical protein